MLIAGRGVTPPYRGQVGGVIRRTDVYPKIVSGRISLIGDCFRSNNNNMAAGKSWGDGCWFPEDCAGGLVCLVEEDGACKFHDSLIICIHDCSF